MRIGRTVMAATSALIAGAAVGLWSSSWSSTRTVPDGDAPSRSSSIEVGRRAIARAIDAGVFSVGAAIAFYAMLSLVPAISVLVSTYGLVTRPSEIPTQLAALELPIPAELRALVLDQAGRIAATSTATLSTTLATSVAIALWSANAAVKATFEGLGRMWELRETRSFVRFNATTLGFTLVAVVTAAAMLSAFATLPAAFALLGDRLPPLLEILRWPSVPAIGFAAVCLLYRHGPDRRPPEVRLQIPGALVATAAWVATSAAFSWYAATLGRYSATYGSLAGVVVVLTWSWLSAVIVLFGGAIAAELEGAPAASAPDRRG